MRRIAIVISAIILIILVAMLALQLAPETSSFFIGENVQQIACLSDADGNCLVMPSVSGVNIDNQSLAFPDAFTRDYYLIVMPFDDGQQNLAQTWLPLFQELTAEFESVHYFSIAPLPNLNPAIRLMVIGGISISVREPEIRSQIAILFLEEQQAFLDALAIDSIETMQILIIDREGLVFYRDTGEYQAEKGDRLREILADLAG
jgi:hypothetical protein